MAFYVLIVDDSQLFLDAARDLLERQGLRLVGLASTSAEAIRQSAELHADVVLHSRADFADLIAESPAARFLPKAELSADAVRRIASGNGPGGGPLSSPAGAS